MDTASRQARTVYAFLLRRHYLQSFWSLFKKGLSFILFVLFGMYNEEYFTLEP